MHLTGLEFSYCGHLLNVLKLVSLTQGCIWLFAAGWQVPPGMVCSPGECQVLEGAAASAAEVWLSLLHRKSWHM
jgi:hypothetical protein